jgi:hypothetical protein
MIAALRRLFSVSRPAAVPPFSGRVPAARRHAPHRPSRITGYATRFRRPYVRRVPPMIGATPLSLAG